jgi:hypothetical protein
LLLWLLREDGSVIYSCCWALPAQSFSVRVLHDSRPNVIVSNLRLPQPGGPGSCIYFTQEQGSRVIPQGIRFQEVEVNLRPTVSRTVCPGVRRPSGTRDQFFFLLEISFRQLRLCYFVARSLTKGRVCNLLVQLLLGLARAVTLGSKSRRPHGLILLSHLRLPQPGGPGSRIYIPQEQGGPVIPPGTGLLFCRLLRLAGTTVEVFYPASTRA